MDFSLSHYLTEWLLNGKVKVIESDIKIEAENNFQIIYVANMNIFEACMPQMRCPH